MSVKELSIITDLVRGPGDQRLPVLLISHDVSRVFDVADRSICTGPASERQSWAQERRSMGDVGADDRCP